MAITFDQQDIQSALDTFKITEDYFFEVTDQAVYLHWTTDQDNVQWYLDNYLECLDIKLYGHWIDTYRWQEQGVKVALPNSNKLIDCRYILATN